MINLDLFTPINEEPYREDISPDAVILRHFASKEIPYLLQDLQKIIEVAPFRQMMTPTGFLMSVFMTSCGQWGWLSDKKGYRYSEIDPLTQKFWPEIPPSFIKLAIAAAKDAGFDNFKPDSCLINRYAPKTKLSLHQDKDEKDLKAPIVSVSIGIPATFLFGGLQRTDKPKRFYLTNGDVVVWGGKARLNYHGILPIKEAYDSQIGALRINLTFRKIKP